MPDSQQLIRLLAKLEKGSRRTNEGSKSATGSNGGGGEEGGGGHEPCCVTVTVVTVTPAVSDLCVCVRRTNPLVGEKIGEKTGGGPVWLGCLPCQRSDPIFPASVVSFGDL